MGIYKIENLVNGKVYIGSSQDINKRWKQHLYSLRKGQHHSYHLQKAWEKYGEENFKFEIVEVVTDESLLITLEQKWINSYKSYDSKYGYNISEEAKKPARRNIDNKNVNIVPKERILDIHKLNLSISDKGFYYMLRELVDENNRVVLDEKPISQSDIGDIFGYSDRKSIYTHLYNLQEVGLLKMIKEGKKNIIYINPLYYLGSLHITDTVINLFM
jgi:predicted GIY-YIG superfamily endonuclease